MASSCQASTRCRNNAVAHIGAVLKGMALPAVVTPQARITRAAMDTPVSGEEP